MLCPGHSFSGKIKAGAGVGGSKGNVNVMECIDCICPLFSRARVPQTDCSLSEASPRSAQERD